MKQTHCSLHCISKTTTIPIKRFSKELLGLIDVTGFACFIFNFFTVSSVFFFLFLPLFLVQLCLNQIYNSPYDPKLFLFDIQCKLK